MQLEEITQQRGISCQSTYSEKKKRRKVRNISQKPPMLADFPRLCGLMLLPLRGIEWLKYSLELESRLGGIRPLSVPGTLCYKFSLSCSVAG